MFKIGQFSKFSAVSVRMIRYYEEIGLFLPKEVDEITGYRYYSASQLDDINFINKLRDLEFSLHDIKEMMDNREDIQGFIESLDEKSEALILQKAEITRKTALITSLKDSININKRKAIIMYSAEFKTVPAKKVMSLAKVISGYDKEGEAWAEMFSAVENMPIEYPANAYSTAKFLDEEYKETDINVEVQMEVVGDYKDVGNVKFYTTEPVEIVSVTFGGGYEQMPEVQKEVASFTEKSEYEIYGSMFNIYHVSPSQDPNPENWVTEACYMVRKNDN